ncbi:MAG: 50S ribosomal protein L11 methyltransferase [Candidatus Buchananbacteria bacterium]|nr:50S ribosomal protein L11 methyltransferase [Candidatus Buchananbacteria bacterium]
MIYILILILIISTIATIMMSSIIIGLVMTGGVPFISTNKKDFKAILKAVDLKPNEVIYDLGCGKAHLLIYASKYFGAKGVGYELTLWPYLWAKLKIHLSQAQVKVFRQNFFRADLTKADVVFCYLFPEVMAKLEPKFAQELKSGSRVVSYGFKLPSKPADKTVITNDDNTELGKIYVYKY